MSSGLIGLARGLLAFTILVGCNVAFYRWAVRRFRVFDRRRALLATILVVLALLGTVGRTLANLGGSDRFAWLEAVSYLWGLSLLIALPAIYAMEWILARTSRGGVTRHEAVAVLPEQTPSPEGGAVIDRRHALAQIGGTFALGASIVPLARGVVTRFDYDVVEIPIRLARLPRALDGFTIVQVSDIHVGVYLGERELRRAEDSIAALRPDLVVMTGDLVHHRPQYLPISVDWVRRLGTRARHGAVSILGNHEYYVGRAAVVDAFERARLDLLINASRVLAPHDGGGLAIVGVDDLWGRGKGFGPDLDRALTGLSPEQPRILLAHQPQFHSVAAERGIDLQLSGHTHGGQIAPLGPVVAQAIYRGRVAGLFREGASSLYVNRGFGTSGPPSRVAVRPEITKIVLVSG